MHIAFLTEMFRSISSTHVRREIEAFRAAGHDVAVWNVAELPVSWQGSRRNEKPFFPLASARVFFKLLTKPLYAWRMSGFLGAALKGIPRPDCLVACGAGLAAVYADILSGLWRVPFFVNVYGSDVFRPWEAGIAALCRAKRVFAPCELVRQRADMLMRGSDHGPIVMPEGVPEAFFQLERVEPSGMVLLFMGKIARKKGLHVLLDALPEIRKRIPEIRLRIAGDGPLRSDFESYVAEHRLDEVVTFLGECDQLTILRELQKARAICIPSVPADDGDVDGIPLVLLEAMASGCPIIASQAGGMMEVMEDFQTGRVVPTGDVEVLAEVVPSVMLASASARRCADSARIAVREHHRLAEAADEKLHFMERALGHAAS